MYIFRDMNILVTTPRPITTLIMNTVTRRTAHTSSRTDRRRRMTPGPVMETGRRSRLR